MTRNEMDTYLEEWGMAEASSLEARRATRGKGLRKFHDERESWWWDGERFVQVRLTHLN
jgi:hypothetical protein